MAALWIDAGQGMIWREGTVITLAAEPSFVP